MPILVGNAVSIDSMTSIYLAYSISLVTRSSSVMSSDKSLLTLNLASVALPIGLGSGGKSLTTPITLPTRLLILVTRVALIVY